MNSIKNFLIFAENLERAIMILRKEILWHLRSLLGECIKRERAVQTVFIV